jgi:hypothetical protein
VTPPTCSSRWCESLTAKTRLQARGSGRETDLFSEQTPSRPQRFTSASSGVLRSHPSRMSSRPQVSSLSVGFIPAGARLAATCEPNARREAVEGQTCVANQSHRDRNDSHSQVRAVRTQDENRSAYLQTCLKQSRSYGLQILGARSVAGQSSPHWHKANGGVFVPETIPVLALLSAGFTPAGARLAATWTPSTREAVEGQACVANQSSPRPQQFTLASPGGSYPR